MVAPIACCPHRYRVRHDSEFQPARSFQESHHLHLRRASARHYATRASPLYWLTCACKIWIPEGTATLPLCSAVMKTSKFFEVVITFNSPFRFLSTPSAPCLWASSPLGRIQTTYAFSGGVRFAGWARLSTFISTFMFPLLLSVCTPISPLAAGTLASAVIRYFFPADMGQMASKATTTTNPFIRTSKKRQM